MNNLVIFPIRRFWRDLPLASKIAVLVSLLVVLVILGLSALNIHRERVGYQEDLELQAALLMDTLPLTLRDQLYLMELDELQNVANEVGDNPNVTQFRVFSREAAAKVRITHAGMAHASEILHEVARHGLSYRELPVQIDYTEYSRAKGQSNLNAINILHDLVSARIRSVR